MNIKSIKPRLLCATLSASPFLLTFPVLANEEWDLNSAVKSVDTLTNTAIGVSYSIAMLVAILFVITGVIVFVASMRSHNDSSNSKKVAASFLIAGVLIGSIDGFINMGSRTFTGQSSEVSSFIESANEQ